MKKLYHKSGYSVRSRIIIRKKNRVEDFAQN